jgi:hypothetical protein
MPKANGKLRPLGISTVRDRVCMTAAMLVLEPIFEADLPSEIYAYRAGRNAPGHADFPASGSRTRPRAFDHGASRPSHFYFATLRAKRCAGPRRHDQNGGNPPAP